MELNDQIRHQIDQWNEEWRGKEPMEFLEFILSTFREKVALATSLGAEDQVITAMIAQLDPSARLFTLDTGRLFPETYDVIDATCKKYGMEIEIFFPLHENVEKMVREKGINLFYDSVENRKLCCGFRKVEPFKRAFQGLDAWICGLRKDQTVSRFFSKLVEWDDVNGLIKINPLIEWTEKDVWKYIKDNDVPYNPLHDAGFASIGCQPCTRAIKPGEDARAGRWWWENEDHKECGLHER